MDYCKLIIKNMNDPHELEKMYRKEPKLFKDSILETIEIYPDSKILEVWKQRLYYDSETKSDKIYTAQNDLIFTGILSLLAGFSTRIIFNFVEQHTISPVSLLFGILPFIAVYFLYNNLPNKKLVYILAASFLISLVYINVLPINNDDTTILAYLHMPVFLWVLLGLAFTGDGYKSITKRISYLKLNGEFVIIYAIMAISGMILTVVTMQLFSILDMDIYEFYFKNVVLFGISALAVVGIHLVFNDMKIARNIAPYIARIFSPLVLVTLCAYLMVVIWVGANPFIDRNFLMTFNIILLIVLAIIIFSITEVGTGNKKTFDIINIALIVTALLIDSVALAAIIFRLTSYGITPNRIAVLGINILIWSNLLLIVKAYANYVRNKIEQEKIQAAVTKFLPVYGIWAAFVTFVFPLLFS
ncbi:DUF4153 domain-containing protein [Alkalibacter mobilis]|uniref:DUF4153 domain-containing protein n=1 Tax=Alkalibacter mobilis TaxID=2787712 RepID=UPI00189CFCD7|nr:DUF4153 domain-containing protein [Alkalibacter mobilis]MBF7097565.1 DUF4153 domain-containing protein [Alkalibacter mobilis]